MISVLLPAYNAERFVAQAIESVLGQTFRDFELVVIDDGSSDRTLAIAEEYGARDARVRVISHGNIGMGESLNLAIEQARYEWLARLDADDRMLPHRLERQLAFVCDNPDVVVAGSFVRYIAEDGRPLGTGRHPHTSRETVRQYCRDNLLIAISHPSVMMRRSVVQAAGGYRPRFWPCEDLDLWNRIVEQGHMVLVQPEVLTEYRKHGSSVCISSARLVEERIRWVTVSMRRRRSGLPEPTQEEFVAERHEGSYFARLNLERLLLARSLYTAAIHHLSIRQFLSFAPRLAGALILDPRHTGPRIWRRLASGG